MASKSSLSLLAAYSGDDDSSSDEAQTPLPSLTKTRTEERFTPSPTLLASSIPSYINVQQQSDDSSDGENEGQSSGKRGRKRGHTSISLDRSDSPMSISQSRSNAPTPPLSSSIISGPRTRSPSPSQQPHRVLSLSLLSSLPEPEGEVDPALQEQIRAMLEKQRQIGQTFNENLKKQRQYSNPEILDKIVELFKIDEFGTHYPPHLWNPYAFEKEEYYDALIEAQKKFMEKRSDAQKSRTVVEFVTSGVSSASASASSAQAPAPAAAPALPIVPQPQQPSGRTKWDQVPIALGSAAAVNFAALAQSKLQAAMGK